MKKFRFIANIEFDAEDLEDATWQLAEHFESLGQNYEGKESPLEFLGEISLKPS